MIESGRPIKSQRSSLGSLSTSVLNIVIRSLESYNKLCNSNFSFHPLNDSFSVAVKNFIDPNFFLGVVQSEDNLKGIESISEALSIAKKTSIRGKQQFCFILEDDLLHRAFIVSSDANLKLYLLDSGRITNAPSKSCFHLPPEVLSLSPPLCAPFQVKDCPCNAKPPRLEEPIFLDCKLETNANNQSLSVFVSATHNGFHFTDYFKKSPPVRSQTNDSNLINSVLPRLIPNRTVSGKVTSVQNVHHFMFQTNDSNFIILQNQVARAVKAALEEYAFKGDDEENIDFACGEIVIAKTNDFTSRAKILSVTVSSEGETFLKVLLLDRGINTIVRGRDVLPCAQNLKNAPFLFYTGSLSKVDQEDIPSCSETTRLFVSIVKNAELKFRINEVIIDPDQESETHCVTILENSSSHSDPSSINKLLLNFTSVPPPEL